MLRKAIDENQGTVVKTMGDAVMAAFKDPFACVRGAVQCLREFEEFRKAHERMYFSRRTNRKWTNCKNAD